MQRTDHPGRLAGAGHRRRELLLRLNQTRGHSRSRVLHSFPKGNCPASKRKPRSSARRRLDRLKKLPHSSPKGASQVPSCHECRGRRRDVVPVGRQGLDASVVPRKAVNAAFNEDETELRISVLAVFVEVLPHRHGLLHEEVQILRDGRSEAFLLEDTQDLVVSDHLYLWHTEAVPQRDTNGRGRHTILRQLANLLAEIFRLQLDPARGPALVRECRRRHALARSIHASHGRLFAQYTLQTTP